MTKEIPFRFLLRGYPILREIYLIIFFIQHLLVKHLGQLIQFYISLIFFQKFLNWYEEFYCKVAEYKNAQEDFLKSDKDANYLKRQILSKKNIFISIISDLFTPSSTNSFFISFFGRGLEITISILQEATLTYSLSNHNHLFHKIIKKIIIKKEYPCCVRKTIFCTIFYTIFSEFGVHTYPISH